MAVRTEDRDPTGSQPPRATRGGRDLADRAGWSQTIVVPLPPASIDPAHVGEAVIPVARAIAGRTGANVTLLTVVDETSPFNPLTQMITRVSAAGEAPGVNEAQEQLARLATAFPSGHVDTVVHSGHAAEEILSVIRESDQPLLMLCSHTRTGLEHCLYGSVAGELVRAAPCPVLVVRGSQATLAEGETPLETVIAPLDQSPFAERALDAALAALGPAGYHVHLLHVIDPSSYPDLAPADLATLVEPKLTRYLHEVALPLLGKGYRVSTEVRYGQPADEIAQAATDQDADVIAMGTHGRGGFHPILLGSVAERLLAAAPVPLLFARPAASARAPGQPAEATPAGADQTEPRATSPALIERRARELMTQPVVVARAETPLEEVATAMVQNRIGCVPIVDERGQLAGIITESDFLRADPGLPLAAYQISPLLHERVPAEAIEQMYRAGRELTAAQIMTHPVTTVTEDTPLGEVAALLLQGRINQVPVERDGAPVGIVARRDLLHLLLPAGDYPAGGAGGE